MTKLGSLFIFLLGATSLASTVVGNPTSDLSVVDGDDVHIEEVEMLGCTTGTETVVIDATLDQGEHLPFDLPDGTYCGLRVHLRWDAGSSTDVVDVDGFDEIVVSESGDAVTVELDETATGATLTTR